ncbi:hypothetical protein EV121DRAFT_277965 [Schizophyllum commune]
MTSNESLRLLLAAYPAAITDFFEKAAIWPQTARLIVSRLDALDVNMQLTAVDPLAYANAGDATLICDFVVVISVKPNSLAQADAAGEAGFSDAQVAVVEANCCRQAKFMSFDPNSELESISILRKPFTFTLGLSIAPHAMPRYEGTGGVFIRLSTDENDKRVYLLTCAHFVLHGTDSYANALGDITKFIDDETMGITGWESALARDEPAYRTDRRAELTGLIDAANRRIATAKELHSDITKKHTSLDSRIFGHLYHCTKIEVGDDGYLNDWALIEPGLFQGNKLYVGGNVTAVDWQKYMFPQHHDHRDFHVPEDLLLQLEDYNRDVNDVDTLLAVKNGHITGTTFGRVNGLDSITRTYDAHGLKVDAKEVLILGYDTKTGKNERFSDGGDSGSIVVDRRGRLIGLLTGGKGPTSATDKSYITPYYRLKKKIEAEFGKAHLLPANFDFLFT